MTEKRRQYFICFGLIALLLAVDQAVKIWVKTTFAIGEGVNLIGEWCQLYFVENEGIAFGISFGQETGKLLLTLFRLVASVCIVIFLVNRINKGARTLFLATFWTAVSMASSSARVPSTRWPCCFLTEEDTEGSFTGKWWTCSISRFSSGIGLIGFLCSEASMRSFSMRYSTWPMLRYAWVSRCCLSTS